MYFPLITPRSNSLSRRKGGGGGGKGGSSSGKSGGSSSGSSSGKSSNSGSSSGSSSNSGSKGSSGSSSSSKSSSVSTGGTTKSASSSSFGGGKSVTIPSGQPFAGRTQGGAMRNQVYGTPIYGSGYPGFAGRGVAGLGFPFYFWPVVWGGAAGAGTAAYLHSNEYGRPDNSSRPGGVMMTAAFPSSSQNTTFRVFADNTTVSSLLTDIQSNCSSLISNPSSITPTAYNDNSTAPPQPEQAVQYYRASSVALTLDGYNNTADDSSDANATNTPLPSNIDTNLLACLNDTIGNSVPLIDAGSLTWGAPPSMGLIGLVWVVWCMLYNL